MPLPPALCRDEFEFEFFLDECGDPEGVARRLELREPALSAARDPFLPRLP